jgi:hypothetical protein
MAAGTDQQSTDDGIELTMWSTSEIAVTIMAASVPILRALLGERRKTKKQAKKFDPGSPRSQWLPKYRFGGADNFEMQSRSTTIIEATHSHHSRSHSDAGAGRKSLGGRSILGSKERPEVEERAEPMDGTIVQTSEIKVEWESPKEPERKESDIGMAV